jgi:lysophospholipase L1-like esterase
METRGRPGVVPPEMEPMRKLVVLILLAALAAVGAVPATAAAKTRTRYYLSLGDSLGAGYQRTATGADSLTPNSYANLIHKRLKRRNPKIKLVNYACPGESTTSYINGGCRFPIDESQKTSQSARALKFIRKNRKRLVLITMSMGSNNFLECVKGLAIDIACIGSAQQRLADETPRILKSLRKAAGKRVKIATLVPYNPYLALSLLGDNYKSLAVTSDSLIQGMRDVITAAARKSRVHVASGYVAFQSNDLQHVTDLNGQLVPVGVARICQLTSFCLPAPATDIHPNDAGYKKLYEAFRKVLKI